MLDIRGTDHTKGIPPNTLTLELSAHIAPTNCEIWIQILLSTNAYGSPNIVLFVVEGFNNITVFAFTVCSRTYLTYGGLC